MLAKWDEYFPECDPIGHLMRDRFRSRWVRFHSLPESKRYPEDEQEMLTVLERHNVILGELLGGEQEVVLLTAVHSESPYAASRYAELVSLDPNAKPWRVVPERYAEVAQVWGHWHVSVSEWTWQPGTFDPFVRLVAMHEIANVMMVHPECRWALHPYDGGMDVILESNAARQRLKSAHREWLSARSDGM
jgi:hypothetical protein